MSSPHKSVATHSFDTSGFAAGMLNPTAKKPDKVIGPLGKKADKRFNVYRNNVTVSLINAVADIFPAVEKIIGESNFRNLAREYVRAMPPSSPLLFNYGQEFGDFIDNFEPISHLAYLGDVARLERGWLTAYHAADLPPLDAGELAQIRPHDLGTTRFEAHPATFVLQSDYPVQDIFLMNRGFDEIQQIDMSVSQSLMLTRPQTDTRILSLNAGELAFMRSILTGETLSEAASAGLNSDEGFDLNTSLQMLLVSGATTKVLLGQSEF